MKKSFSIILITALFVVAYMKSVIPLAAADTDISESGEVYVSDSGDDSAPGTAEAPFRTLQRAFRELSDDVRTAEGSGGEIIITDMLTLMDSEEGKITNSSDKERYAVTLSDKCTGRVVLRGLNNSSKLVFANSFIGGMDYNKYQGRFSVSSPFSFSDIDIVYSNGRLVFDSSVMLEFTNTVTASTSNDVYVNGSGDFRFFGGAFNHIFAPTSDRPTHILFGGTAVANNLWLGLGTVKNDVSVEISGEGQINTIYLGGQAKNFSGNIDILITGGYISTLTRYSAASVTGEVNILYAGVPSRMPSVASQANRLFILDYSLTEGMWDELLPYTFTGILKYMPEKLPEGFSPDGAYITAYYTFTTFDSSMQPSDFPLSRYAMRLPDDNLTSDSYCVYASVKGKPVKCVSDIGGTDSRTVIFTTVSGADGYALAHTGSAAPLRQDETEEPGGTGQQTETGAPQTGSSESERRPSAPIVISRTAWIIIAIAAVTAAVETVMICSYKKSKNKKQTIAKDI